jgi:predicted short-subunit dehydrogenase-like oxidoreductase (DUF2520 family)
MWWVWSSQQFLDFLMRTAPYGGWNVERCLVTTFRVLGPGRAGRSLSTALETVGGYRALGAWGRDRSPVDAARGVDILVIATPDDVVADVAAAVRPVDSTTVLHLSGSLGLDVLAGHARRGSLHPLVPLPTPAIGSERLRSGITFAVAGDPAARAMAVALGGNVVEVADRDRAAYHAAAVIAANHLVALMGQVERVAATAGLPLEAFAGLMRAATEDALTLGPRAALTGPAVRGDWETVERHRAAIAGMPAHRTELAGYDAMVALARRLSLDTAERLDPVGPGEPEPVPVGAAAVADAEQVA